MFATGVSFATFGVCALCLSCALIPAGCLFVSGHRRRAATAQRYISASFRLFVWFMRALRVLDYKIENAARLRDDAGALVVANHPTLIDYVFLTSLMPACGCVVKTALWNNFFMRGVIRLAGYIPNSEPATLLAACGAELAAGGRILIFPEGTRTTPGEPLVLQRGAANIAVRCGADLRVVRIACAPPVLTKHRPWWRTAPSRPFFTISVGEKIRVADFTAGGVPPSHAARLLNERLRAALSAPAATDG